jgi:hypothetical protein
MKKIIFLACILFVSASSLMLTSCSGGDKDEIDDEISALGKSSLTINGNKYEYSIGHFYVDDKLAVQVTFFAEDFDVSVEFSDNSIKSMADLTVGKRLNTTDIICWYSSNVFPHDGDKLKTDDKPISGSVSVKAIAKDEKHITLKFDNFKINNYPNPLYKDVDFGKETKVTLNGEIEISNDDYFYD